MMGTTEAPLREPIRRPSAWRRDRRLDHIPGDDGWPVIGRTFTFLADQEGWGRRMVAAHGPIFRTNTFLERSVTLADPDVVDQVLRDKERLFSSEHGWDNLIGRFFRRGLMLRDFDEHRLHRGILQEAFKKAALQGYLDVMNPGLARSVAGWGGEGFVPFYPRLKRLTLELAGEVFTGVGPGAELDRLNDAFVAMMAGSFTLLRIPLPGTVYGRAVAARAWMERWFGEQVAARRAGEGTDLFSRLCRATDEQGLALSDQDVVDHMIFLMLAAHDTTTSALTNLVLELGRDVGWQRRLREQFLALDGPHVGWEDLARLGDVDLALKEILRLYPPVTAIPRLALREVELGGYRIPKHTVVWLDASVIQRLPSLWTDPDRFDPDRFSDARAEHRRHPSAWFPYSSGAHVCLGLQFSIVQIKAVLYELLTRFRVELPEGYAPRRQLVPFPKPVDDLPVRLVPW